MDALTIVVNRLHWQHSVTEADYLVYKYTGTANNLIKGWSVIKDRFDTGTRLTSSRKRMLTVFADLMVGLPALTAITSAVLLFRTVSRFDNTCYQLKPTTFPWMPCSRSWLWPCDVQCLYVHLRWREVAGSTPACIYRWFHRHHLRSHIRVQFSSIRLSATWNASFVALPACILSLYVAVIQHLIQCFIPYFIACW